VMIGVENTGMIKKLTAENPVIKTANVEVETLTISGKQVTLAVFRQLPTPTWSSGAQSTRRSDAGTAGVLSFWTAHTARSAIVFAYNLKQRKNRPSR
jgi:hypothetical protein